MQVAAREKPPVGIVFDCDLGDSIDDTLALALLHGFASLKSPESRLVSVSLTKSNLQAAAFSEVVSRFYSDQANRDIPERYRRYREMAIGLSDKGWSPDGTPLLTVPLTKRDADGKPLYFHEIERLTDTADPVTIIRNALTAQHDQNAIVVLSGPATNLARVLDLRNAKDLIAAKVRFLSVMGGAYPRGGPEYNIKSDIAAAKKLFAEWPTPIVASGVEVGNALHYPGESIEKDFGWAENHPIVDAYRAYKQMPYDTPSWDITAALYALGPEDSYFSTSMPGTIQVLDDGQTEFEASPGGKHRYLILEASQKERIIQTFREVISAQPAPRELPRFLRRIIAERKKKEEEEKKIKEEQQQTGPRVLPTR